jgi:hypothetical protein
MSTRFSMCASRVCKFCRTTPHNAAQRRTTPQTAAHGRKAVRSALRMAGRPIVAWRGAWQGFMAGYSTSSIGVPGSKVRKASTTAARLSDVSA